MRLFTGGEWYEAVVARTHPEFSFEEMLLDNSGSIFPGFAVARFKRRLKTPLGGVEADLIMIDSRYRGWYLIEVERADHPLESHVLPQCERLVSVQLRTEDIDSAASAVDGLDRERVIRLLSDVPHQTTVIVNAHAPGWREALAGLGVRVAVVEIFRNRLDKKILRLNGEQPEPFGDLVSDLVPASGWFGGAFRVLTPAALPSSPEIEVLTPTGIDTWNVRKIGPDVFLFPNGERADSIGHCALVEDPDGVLVLRT